MKKVYLLTGTLFAFTCIQAQQLVPYAKFGQTKGDAVKQHVTHKAAPVQKNEGDPIYDSDFSTSSDWTFTDNSVPTMGTCSLVIGTQAPQGDFSSGMDAIASTTGANGFALIDSDYGYTATGQQDVKLTWNQTMDFTTYPHVNLQFQSYHRKFNDSIYVEFNVDGAGWTAYQIEIDADLTSGDNSANPKIYDMNVSSIVGGHASVQMRFRYLGEWDYAWMIDDVVMYETYNNEMILNQVYNSTVDGEDYYKIPASQSSFPGLTFGAWASNEGAANQSVKLSVTQNGGTAQLGDPYAIASETEDSITMITPISLVTGTNTFHLKTDIGVADQNETNNETDMVVTMSGNELSRHDGVVRKYFNYVATDDGFRAGNLYHISDGMAVAGVRAHINSAATNLGHILFADIELYDADNDVFNSLNNVEAEITADNNGSYVDFDFSDAGIELAADAYVRVWVGNYTETDAVRISTAQKTLPSISLIGFYDSGSNEYTTYWTEDAPMVSLIEGVAGLNEKQEAFAVSIFPNPAVDEAKVSFDLKNTADNVAITVTDLTGKVIYTTALGSTAAGKHNVDINTAVMAGGIYSVSINASNAIVTKKLVVKK